MEQITNITVDVARPGLLVIHEKQNDSGRWIYATLSNNSSPFEIPVGSYGMIRILKPDRTVCLYDSDEHGEAVIIDGNTIKILLVDQALTAAGFATAEIGIFNSSSERITSFNFRIDIEKSAVSDQEIESSDYYNILTAEIAHVTQMYEDTQGMTVSSESLPPTEEADATITGGAGSPFNIHFKIPRGATGLTTGFITYSNSGNGYEIDSTDWVSDATYVGYSYRYDISLSSAVTDAMTAIIIPSAVAISNGNLFGICQVHAGGVYVYSNRAIDTRIEFIMVIDSTVGG